MHAPLNALYGQTCCPDWPLMDGYRVSRAQEMWLPLGLAAIPMGASVGAFLERTPAHGLWDHFVPWIGMCVGAPFLCYAVFYRLRWSPQEYMTTWGRWKWRGVHLDCLVSLAVGSAGTSVWVEVVDGHGCRMKLNQVAGWTDQREWGPLLADAARRCGARMDERTESFLVKTPSERRWGTPDDQGPGRHERRKG